MKNSEILADRLPKGITYNFRYFDGYSPLSDEDLDLVIESLNYKAPWCSALLYDSDGENYLKYLKENYYMIPRNDDRLPDYSFIINGYQGYFYLFKYPKLEHWTILMETVPKAHRLLWERLDQSVLIHTSLPTLTQVLDPNCGGSMTQERKDTVSFIMCG